MKWKYVLSSILLFLIPQIVLSQTIIPIDFLYTIGKSGDSLGQFSRPQAISIDLSGNIYVADTGNHRIQRFDEKGNFVAYLGGIGIGSEQFDTPTDVCATDGLNVFVVDHNNHRIHRLDRKLNAVSVFTGSSIIENGYQFSFPKGIVVTSQGDQFIVESEKNSVLKFNSFYSPIIRFGAIETGEGVLNQPEKIEIINNEFICVSDGQASRIAVFDYFGNFIQYLGEDVLGYPNGIFYWKEKKLLLVADLNLKSIFAFNLSGDFYKFSAIQKDPKLKWQSPVDLAIKQNQLFVLDQELHQIFVYRLAALPK